MAVCKGPCVSLFFFLCSGATGFAVTRCGLLHVNLFFSALVSAPLRATFRRVPQGERLQQSNERPGVGIEAISDAEIPNEHARLDSLGTLQWALLPRNAACVVEVGIRCRLHLRVPQPTLLVPTRPLECGRSYRGMPPFVLLEYVRDTAARPTNFPE